MSRFARTKLALVGLSVASPFVAQAGDIPSYANGGYKTPAQSAKVVDGRVVRTSPAQGAPVTGTLPPTSGTVILTEAQARAMKPQGQIVACAHSRHGVCPACQAVLDMPGTVTMMGAPVAGAPASAPVVAEPPGRAVVSAPGHNHGQVPSGLVSSEEGPAPIGVVQTNYQNGPAMGMPAPAGAAQARPMAPGRAVAGGGMDPMAGMGGSAPYQKPRGELRPNILGHLFGWSYIGKDYREARDFSRDQARSKSRAAAAMSAMNPSTGMNELPSGMVYGPRQ